jgi:hypothetical protein
MRKIFIVIILYSITSCMAYCQQDSLKRPLLPKNNIFIELGGNSYFFSINYERMVIHKGLYDGSCRIGLLPLQGILPEDIYSISLILNNSLRLNKWCAIELGAGMSLVTFHEHQNENVFINNRYWHDTNHWIIFPAGFKIYYLKKAFIKIDIIPLYSLERGLHCWWGVTLAGFSWGGQHKKK